jgi:hypothetical protein
VEGIGISEMLMFVGERDEIGADSFIPQRREGVDGVGEKILPQRFSRRGAEALRW